MIIVDTREQKPIWDPMFSCILSRKLNEGDYTTQKLLNIAHIERKSGSDLYGSLIQNHTRFRAEIQRAIDKNIKLAVFVECTKADFINKRFNGGYRLKVKAGVLVKIISTMEEKYGLEFHWCEGRSDLRTRALTWFQDQAKVMKTNKSKFVGHNVTSRPVAEIQEKKSAKWV